MPTVSGFTTFLLISIRWSNVISISDRNVMFIIYYLTSISSKIPIFYFLICWFIQQILTPTFSFFLVLRVFLNFAFSMLCMWQMSCMGKCGCEKVCALVCMCGWVCAGMHGCVWYEFSEYLLETRFLTSANYNTHPLQIFFKNPCNRDIYYSKIIPGFVRILTIEDPL